jgi:uncharacterized Zn finger protein
MYYGFKPYVTVAKRKEQAGKVVKKLMKKGHSLKPVKITGRTIAATFWGKAWCDNLEHYSDYENRLPRGRRYVRNGSVVDLDISPGEVTALVSGSRVYQVTVKVAGLDEKRWKGLCSDCSGSIDSIVELLSGHLSKAVMERMCNQKTGLFPSPKDIEFTCSCPDWAYMCKHVAAVLYGIGARLDSDPELLFRLRKLNIHDLIEGAGKKLDSAVKKKPASKRLIATGDVKDIFGLDMAGPEPGTKAKVKREKSGTKKQGKAGRKNALGLGMKIGELGLSLKTRKILLSAGYEYARQIADASDAELLMKKNLGKKTLKEIRKVIAAILKS